MFVGNPGTGKTTVARLLAQIFHTLGVVSKGHLVETDRSGLVAGYVGQTAPKVNEICRAGARRHPVHRRGVRARAEGGESDFGAEAIATLLKQMEDHRDDLIVIVAGYPAPMEEFLDANPGLRSRFPKTIEFPDYTDDEMLAIFESIGEEPTTTRSTPAAREGLQACARRPATRPELRQRPPGRATCSRQAITTPGEPARRADAARPTSSWSPSSPPTSPRRGRHVASARAAPGGSGHRGVDGRSLALWIRGRIDDDGGGNAGSGDGSALGCCAPIELEAACGELAATRASTSTVEPRRHHRRRTRRHPRRAAERRRLRRLARPGTAARDGRRAAPGDRARSCLPVDVRSDRAAPRSSSRSAPTATPCSSAHPSAAARSRWRCVGERRGPAVGHARRAAVVGYGDARPTATRRCSATGLARAEPGHERVPRQRGLSTQRPRD